MGLQKIKIDMKRAKSDDVSSFGNWSTTISIESMSIEYIEYTNGTTIKSEFPIIAEIVYTSDELNVWPISKQFEKRTPNPDRPADPEYGWKEDGRWGMTNPLPDIVEPIDLSAQFDF